MIISGKKEGDKYLVVIIIHAIYFLQSTDISDHGRFRLDTSDQIYLSFRTRFWEMVISDHDGDTSDQNFFSTDHLFPFYIIMSICHFRVFWNSFTYLINQQFDKMYSTHAEYTYLK
jgi:hypothetical protein